MRFVTSILIVVLSLSSCNKLEGEGAIMSQSYPVSNYDNLTTLSLESGFTLTLCDDVEEGVVEVTTYQNVLSHIDLVIDSNKMTLGLDSSNTEGDLQLYGRMKAPSKINTFEASGTSTFSIEDDMTLNSCSIVLSGGSSLFGYKLTSTTTNIYLSGSSTLQITSLGEISGSCSGGSFVSYKGTGTTNVETTGSSSIVNVD